MKNNYRTLIDFGASKIRIGVAHSNNISKNIFLDKECKSNLKIKEFNIFQSKEIIYQLIQELEKKFGTHLDNVTLMIDTPDLFSIDISIKKNLIKKKLILMISLI